MNTEQFDSSVWVVMLILSILLLTWTVLVFAGGRAILEQSFVLARSATRTADMDAAAVGFLTMAMRKPLWEEVWIGLLGIYCALGLRNGSPSAWTLSLWWGIMMITNGVIQGGYELVGLGWSRVCLQTYLFLLLGAAALTSLLITRQRYARARTRR